MAQLTIGILGGTGFVGQHLCAKLAYLPYDVRVFTRRPDLNRDLTIFPNLKLIPLDIHDPKQLSRGLVGCDVIFNLVGILNKTKRFNFQKVHVELVKNLIAICQLQGIQRLLYISALNANPKGPSEYLRTKGEAEKYLNQSNNLHFHTTIFRPSVMFGPGDNFFTQFAHLLKFTPGLMVLPCAQSLYAPVYVDDVVDAMIKSINDKSNFHETYDLPGPEVYSLKELVRITALTMNKKCLILGLNKGFSKLAASILQYFPGKPLTPDNYLSTTLPNISQTPFPEIFQIQPTGIHNILPQYIGKEALEDPFAAFRKLGPPV